MKYDYLLEEIANSEDSELIQSLWSDYGSIKRYTISNAPFKTYIVKHVDLRHKGNHPRGWNTNLSHQRKLRSYQVEWTWYERFSSKCTDYCKVPKLYYSEAKEESQILILEDLDGLGFSKRLSTLGIEEAKVVIRWLANFHATFLNHKVEGLWEEGTYWHLRTRPDELEKMESGPLKENAEKISIILAKAKFQTIVHGDAKVANFCFTEDMQKVAAVDFQYAGKGCGMKDLAYFLGSCINPNQLETNEELILNYYFKQLRLALENKCSTTIIEDLEREWRSLYAFAWADFHRFLLGWMPNHHKLNHYSLRQVNRVLERLKDYE